MAGYHDLEVYNEAFELAVQVHIESLKLPKFELYEQGSQVRRSSKSIKDTISEGYGRRRYKADFIKFLVYAQASCDECTGQIEMINRLYPEIPAWTSLIENYLNLGKRINRFIQYVEANWKS